MRRYTLYFVLASSALLACFGKNQSGDADPAIDADEGAPDVPQATSNETVPVEPGALLAYLQRGDYRGFTRESASHVSTGPHGRLVRTYLNASLLDTLERGALHAAGAASVKEFVDANDAVTGWAVEVKLQADSDGGRGWYWYEIFNPSRPSSALEGVGISACTSCHSEGNDFVQVPFPLQ